MRYGGQTKDKIISVGEDLGYTMNYQELFAPEYGVPQIRKRVFFVGSKLGKFEFPKKTHSEKEFVTCSDAIGDLPSLKNYIGSEESDYEQDPSTKYQKTMIKVSDEIGLEYQLNNRKEEDEAVNVMKDYGLQVNDLSLEQIEEWNTLVESMYPLIRGNIVQKEIFDRVIKLKDKMPSRVK